MNDAQGLDEQREMLEALDAELRDDVIVGAVKKEIDSLMPIWDFVQKECMTDIIWKALKHDRVDILEALASHDMLNIDPYETREVTTDATRERNFLGAAIDYKANKVIDFLHTQDVDFVDRLYGKAENGTWDSEWYLSQVWDNKDYHHLLNYYVDKDISVFFTKNILSSAINHDNMDIIDNLVAQTKHDLTSMRYRTLHGFTPISLNPIQSDLNLVQHAIYNEKWDIAYFLMDLGIFKVTHSVDSKNNKNIKDHKTILTTINAVSNDTLLNNPSAQKLKIDIHTKAVEELKQQTSPKKKKRFIVLKR